ncbi:MAG TPA: HD domain-containing protein [Terriglobia bacterium]|nr:HD domain-containing protein [Terriglobia bacterium]
MNDPIWGTIELRAWEVALLDTPLLQRLRGVRQLGLAQYVFPGAAHDRLEHTCGVLGAVEAMIQALSRQIERANRSSPISPLPEITVEQHTALRLAALLHDIGHGPFSHAIELLLAHSRDTPDLKTWRTGIVAMQRLLKTTYQLNKPPSTSESLAVAMIATRAMGGVLGHPNLPFPRPSVSELQHQIMAGVVGAIDGPGASHLTRIISSQIDGDKLDYLARDAHHTGLEIGFDTDRLLAKLEVLWVTRENTDPSLGSLRVRADHSPGGHYLEIGIAASGFGSFEQMLIGRTFLYDRLYHHHKVRAADAMAQRLVLAAEAERQEQFRLEELFIPVSDDTMIRLLGGEVTMGTIHITGQAAGRLAHGILARELYHRAFAFRGRLIVCPEGLTESAKEGLRRAKWSSVTKTLDKLEGRLALERAIFDIAKQIVVALRENGVTTAEVEQAESTLNLGGAEQVIVDLSEQKADAIRTLARYPDGTLRVPEFSFNPVKWADAYELQKRTGYVFCPRDVVPIVAIAAKLVFLERFGIVMSREADAYIKARSDLPAEWRSALQNSGLMDDAAFSHLDRETYTLIRIEEKHIPAPAAWLEDDPDFAVRIAAQLNGCLPSGLVDADLKALEETFSGLFAFIDGWHAGPSISSQVENEADLQGRLRTFLVGRGLKVVEGASQSGGKYDLFVQDRILLENKFTGQEANPETWAAGAATQGRRYAVALSSRIIFIPLAYIPTAGAVPAKPKSFAVRPISPLDNRRAEIRMLIPYGAPSPSRESPYSAYPAEPLLS